jgi:hypothetical protein
MKKLVFLLCLALTQSCAMSYKNMHNADHKPLIKWHATNNAFPEMYHEMIPNATQHFIDAVAMHSLPTKGLRGYIESYEIRVLDVCSVHPCNLAGVYLGYHGLKRIDLAVFSLQAPAESAYCHELLHLYEHRVVKADIDLLLKSKSHFLLGDEVSSSIITICKGFMNEEQQQYDIALDAGTED